MIMHNCLARMPWDASMERASLARPILQRLANTMRTMTEKFDAVVPAGGRYTVQWNHNEPYRPCTLSCRRLCEGASETRSTTS